MARRSGGTSIQSVERAVSLLTLVARQSVNSAGKDLADAAGLAVPTAHHLLSTLVSAGLLAKDANARYSLGPRVATPLGDGHVQRPARRVTATAGGRAKPSARV